MVTIAFTREQQEEAYVKVMGEKIGFGRMMQLGEKLWREHLGPLGIAGGEHSVGPCVALLVQCPHPDVEDATAGGCDWCCGSGRVTKRVLDAMNEPSELKKVQVALSFWKWRPMIVDDYGTLFPVNIERAHFFFFRDVENEQRH